MARPIEDGWRIIAAGFCKAVFRSLVSGVANRHPHSVEKRLKIALAILFLAGIGVVGWLGLKSTQPVYQGKHLDRWLDEYNRVGSMDKTEPVSKAIRAMGTNCLPFLLAHIKHTESPLKLKLIAILQKQKLVRLPFYGADPYQSTSVLALRALDSQAAPLCPGLLPFAQDPSTRWIGMLSLLAIGTSSIPTLERACQCTNIQVRQDAVLMMAMQKVMPPPWFSWNWSKAPINGKPLFELGLVVPEQDVGEMVNLLEHSDPAVRRASAEVIGLYTRPPYTAVARSAIPLLIQDLKDRDQAVSKVAGETLKKIDPEVAAKAGVK